VVPLDKTLEAFGADVQWDDYAQMFTLIKDGAYVKVLIKVSETQALPSFITTGTGRSRGLPLTIAVLAPPLSTTCSSPVSTRPSRWKNALTR
jgi:hypothetical protein